MNVNRLKAVNIKIKGVQTRINISKNSKVCRLLTKKDFITLGHTIYTRSPILNRKILMAGLAEIMNRYHIGSMKHYWFKLRECL